METNERNRKGEEIKMEGKKRKKKRKRIEKETR